MNYDHSEYLDRGAYSIEEVAKFIGLTSDISLTGKLAKDTPIKNWREAHFDRDFEYDKEFVSLNGRKLKGVRGYYAKFDGRGYKKGDCVYAEFETPDGISYSYYLRPQECDGEKGYISVADQINSKLKSVNDLEKDNASSASNIATTGYTAENKSTGQSTKSFDAINAAAGSSPNKTASQSTPVVTAPKPRHSQTKLQSGIANAHVGNSNNASAETGVGTPSSTVADRTTAPHVGASYSSHTVLRTETSTIRTHSTQTNTSVSISQNAPEQKNSASNNIKVIAKGNENNMATFGDLTKLDEESLKEFYTSLSDFISNVTKSCNKMDSEIAACDEEMRDPLCKSILSVNREILYKIQNCIEPAKELKLDIDKLFNHFESVAAIEGGLQ